MSLAAIFGKLFGRTTSLRTVITGSLFCGTLLLIGSLLTFTVTVTGCTPELGDAALTQNTRIELVDWHISGLWVINCPVCWIRVANYNNDAWTGATWRFNGSARYDINDHLRLSLSVNNLLDKMPPKDATWANYPYYDTSWFDSTGRSYYLQLTWKLGGKPL